MKQVIKPILLFLLIQVICILECMFIFGIYAGIHPIVTFDDVLIPALGLGLFLADSFAIWYFLRKDYIDKSEATWSAISGKTLLFTFILTIFAMFIYDGILNFVPAAEDGLDIFDKLFNNLFAILSITIVGPILEEILFRGIVLRKLLTKLTPRNAIFVSSLIFGVIHGNPQQFVFGFMFGILLGWIYYKTGSLIPAILMHMVNNSIVTALHLTAPQFDSYYDIMPLPQYAFMFIASLLICAVCIWALNKWNHFSWPVSETKPDSAPEPIIVENINEEKTSYTDNSIPESTEN